jgi:hypothetical protein
MKESNDGRREGRCLLIFQQFLQKGAYMELSAPYEIVEKIEKKLKTIEDGVISRIEPVVFDELEDFIVNKHKPLFADFTKTSEFNKLIKMLEKERKLASALTY